MIDWSKVDWSKTDSEIADELKCSRQAVWDKRRNLRLPRVPAPRGRHQRREMAGTGAANDRGEKGGDAPVSNGNGHERKGTAAVKSRER